MESKLQISSFLDTSIVDGPGIRGVLFVQGCNHHCKNCHNPTTWDYNGGTTYTVSEIGDIILSVNRLNKITFSGGEPFDQCKGLADLCEYLNTYHKYNFISYTGYTYEELVARNCPDTNRLISYLDMLVDGPYIDAERSLELNFRGSRNQRIINIPCTLAHKDIVLSEYND